MSLCPVSVPSQQWRVKRMTNWLFISLFGFRVPPLSLSFWTVVLEERDRGICTDFHVNKGLRAATKRVFSLQWGTKDHWPNPNNYIKLNRGHRVDNDVFYWIFARSTGQLAKGQHKAPFVDNTTNRHLISPWSKHYLHSTMGRNGSILYLLVLILSGVYILAHFGMAQHTSDWQLYIYPRPECSF